jgi:hypothetical protein
MTPSARSCNVCGTENPSQAAFWTTCGGLMEGEIPLPSNATGLMQQDQLLKQRYRILAHIGRGGFAAVYQAEDLLYWLRGTSVHKIHRFLRTDVPRSQYTSEGQTSEAKSINSRQQNCVIVAMIQFVFTGGASGGR